MESEGSAPMVKMVSENLARGPGYCLYRLTVFSDDNVHDATLYVFAPWGDKLMYCEL
jgi:hypothetical protein